MKDSDIKVVGLSSSKSKGKTNWKIIGAMIGIIVLALGVIAGIILVRQQQDIREKASITYGRCDEEGAEACPGADGILRNCHPPEDDNTPVLSNCDRVGRIEFCGTQNYCCNGTAWTADMSACAAASPTAVATATSASSTRPDYCVSASADKAVLNPNDMLTVSSISNTPVNGFAYAVYNLDNLYGPGNAKPVCTGAGNATSDCPNGGTHLILSDPDTSSLRTNGSTQITYGRLFITDKSTGQQLKNAYFMAYFSLNGGQVSWPQDACKAYTRMASVAATATATSTSHATATATATNTTAPTATSTTRASSTATSTSHATATSTTRATATATSAGSTSHATATATSTSGLARSTSTSVPLPVTGAKWPTIVGAGFGIIMLLVSLALAL